MPKQRKWSDSELIEAVKNSVSIRSTIDKLGLIPAGGNYVQVKQRIKTLDINTEHFMGKAWNKGLRWHMASRPKLSSLLVKDSSVQSYKLKSRLFEENIKKPECEICGWSKQAENGRIPVELDHINGDRYDNRLANLRILCPNCHSLQPTHRGRNKKHF